MISARRGVGDEAIFHLQNLFAFFSAICFYVCYTVKWPANAAPSPSHFLLAMKPGDRTTVTNPANEATPLLPRAEDLPPPASEKAQSWLKPKPIHLVLLCGFFASLSFGVTQVPIVYVFRLMTCEAYYAHHPTQVPHDGRDRCSLPTIEAGTARAVSLLGITTTFFGVINLFITGWTISDWGSRQHSHCRSSHPPPGSWFRTSVCFWAVPQVSL